MKVAILGATGYTGQMLMRLLALHGGVEAIFPVSSSQAGAALRDSDTGLGKALGAKLPLGMKLLDIQDAVQARPDVVFAALPHLKSATVCEPFFGSSVLIDLSADFRIRDHGKFQAAYGVAPPRPDLLDKAVYGLCEWRRDEIRTADIIANPGCYPTATLLALLPLARKGLVAGDVVVNALSGISGAGRKAVENNLFCTRTENLNAYSPGKTHRHQTEIQDQLDLLAGISAGPSGHPADLDIFFTPHLVPVKQGMEITTSVRLAPGTTDQAIVEAFRVYDAEPCVEVGPGIPMSIQVRGSNRCDISWHREGDRIFLFSVIDNLVKGASGQAVQNMNIRFGLAETEGLPLCGEIF